MIRCVYSLDAVPSAMPALNVGSLLKKSSGQLTQQAGNMSDDEPLYDAVASDDDYATLTPIPKQQQQTQQQPVRMRPIKRVGTYRFECFRVLAFLSL